MDAGGGGGGGVGNCSLVMVLAGALQNGESDGSGGLLFDLASAPAAQLPGGDGFTAVAVADTVSISLFQSSITLRYPTTYVRDENDAPAESVYLTDGGGAAFGLGNPCRDADGDASVGCGWELDASGARVPFSQGFCCRCSVSDTLSGTFVPRSGQTCRFAERHDSAHCLRMAPLWFSAFAIGAPALDFLIVLTVLQCRPSPAALAASANASAAFRCSAPGPGCECATLDSAALGVPLGPRQPSRCFALPLNADQGACDIQVSLEGTFVAYEGTPDFASKLLLVPTACAASAPPGDACWPRLVEAPGHWLVVEKAAVSVAGGSECNKVGAGFEAFATQGAACASPRGTCLANQPRALYAADAAAEAAGLAPSYFLSAFREASAPAGAAGAPMLDATAAELLSARTAPRTLALPTTRFQKSLVQLTFRADPGSLRLVIKASAGRLLAADAPPFRAGGAGALVVLMASTGAVASHFTVSVSCPPAAAILPVPARDVSVAAGANASVAFTLQPAASTAAASASCDVVLVSALGTELDRLRVSVNLSQAPVDATGQGGTHVGANGGGAGAAANASGAGAGGGLSLCGSKCSSWFDIVCAAGAAASCVGELSGWTAGLGAASLMLALLAFKRPALLLAPLRAAARLCCAGGGAKGREGEAEERAEERAGSAGTAAAAAASPQRPRGKRRAAAATTAAPVPLLSSSPLPPPPPPPPPPPSPSGGTREHRRFVAALAARPELGGPALVELLRRSRLAPPAPTPSSARVVEVDDDPSDVAAVLAPGPPRGRGRHHKHREQAPPRAR